MLTHPTVRLFFLLLRGCFVACYNSVLLAERETERVCLIRHMCSHCLVPVDELCEWWNLELC